MSVSWCLLVQSRRLFANPLGEALPVACLMRRSSYLRVAAAAGGCCVLTTTKDLPLLAGGRVAAFSDGERPAFAPGANE
jgi:hypothetical protein